MDIYRIKDKYNSNKIWIVKKYACGHYYVNQKIGDFMYYKRYIKMKKNELIEIGIIGGSGGYQNDKEGNKRSSIKEKMVI